MVRAEATRRPGESVHPESPAFPFTARRDRDRVAACHVSKVTLPDSVVASIHHVPAQGARDRLRLVCVRAGPPDKCRREFRPKLTRQSGDGHRTINENLEGPISLHVRVHRTNRATVKRFCRKRISFQPREANNGAVRFMNLTKLTTESRRMDRRRLKLSESRIASHRNSARAHLHEVRLLDDLKLTPKDPNQSNAELAAAPPAAAAPAPRNQAGTAAYRHGRRNRAPGASLAAGHFSDGQQRMVSGPDGRSGLPNSRLQATAATCSNFNDLEREMASWILTAKSSKSTLKKFQAKVVHLAPS